MVETSACLFASASFARSRTSLLPLHVLQAANKAVLCQEKFFSASAHLLLESKQAAPKVGYRKRKTTVAR